MASLSPVNPDTTSGNDEVWDEDFLAGVDGSEDSKFSDVLNEDFLLMDDGLQIEDDDFSGLLDISPSAPFESQDSYEESQDSSEEKTEKKSLPVLKQTPPEKRSSSDSERSLSPATTPTSKKQRTYGSFSPSSSCSVTSTKSIASVASISSIPSLNSEYSGGEDKYKLALQHLALSMRRSEMTRNEIIRQRKEAEIKAKLAAAQEKTVTNAEIFLTGNSVTLTAGLEQSRQMLQAFMSGAKTLPF